MTDFAAARTHMIESQLRPNRVTDERVLEAFARVRRELFVPEAVRAIAYIDEDLPIGRGRYVIEPRVAARLIQAAAPQRTDTALVVGAGTGYEAAVLSGLTRTVVALEEDPQLARAARRAGRREPRQCQCRRGSLGRRPPRPRALRCHPVRRCDRRAARRDRDATRRRRPAGRGHRGGG